MFARHRFDVDFIRHVADVLGQKLLDVGDRRERNRLFEQRKVFVFQVAEDFFDLFLILHVAVGEIVFVFGVILAQVLAKRFVSHRNAEFDVAVFGDPILDDEEVMFLAVVVVDVENDARRERFFVEIVVPFQRDVRRETPVPQVFERTGAVVADLPFQIAFQRPTRFFVRRFVERSSGSIAQKDDLHRVDQRRFPGGVLPGEKVDLIEVERHVVEIVPVDDSYFFQQFHRYSSRLVHLFDSHAGDFVEDRVDLIHVDDVENRPGECRK